MNSLNGILNAITQPLTALLVAGMGFLTRAFTLFSANPAWWLAGFYVFMVALKGGKFSLGSKAGTSVK